MAFTSYSTWVAGTVLTAAQLNQQVRDNGNILKTSIGDDGKLASSGGVLTNPEVRGPKQTRVGLTIVGGILTVDLNAADYFEFQVNANWTLSAVNAPTSGRIASFILTTLGNGTAYTANWSVIQWPGGIVPIVTPTLNKRDFYMFIHDPAWPAWYGFVMGQNV